MNLDRMLDLCRRDTWRVEDLDWSGTPRPLPREQEERIVQAFTDMAAIETLAGALFEIQRDRVADPRLRQIFDTFVEDERRHAEVARRLARHYDVHRYRDYRVNPHLRRFAPAFVAACRWVSPEVANIYVTTGELLLDIALLRSLDDFVGDPMSERAMARINRDESRHVAVDFYMIERYCTDPATAAQPSGSLLDRAKGAWCFVRMIRYARPFIREVFLDTLDAFDPSGRRMQEAIKRMQLIARRPQVARRPFIRFLRTMQTLIDHPLIGRALASVVPVLAGVDARILRTMYTDQELHRSLQMDMAQLADDALAVKQSERRPQVPRVAA